MPLPLLALVILPLFPLNEPDLSRIPPRWREGVRASWELAGRNREALEEFLASCPDSLMEEAGFLVASMPYPDLGVVDAQLLRDNLHWAVVARGSLPWGRAVPDSLFLTCVLPARVSGERLQPWREVLFHELLPVVAPCTTMSQAVLAVNRWVDERVEYAPTEARDQAPLTTLRRGRGRCEEMTMLFMAAARAVAIPCRQAWTPWWQLADGNHAWTEVWVDGAWHYLGSGEYAPRLDEAWFTAAARQAPVVYAVSSAPTDGPTQCRSSRVNVTPSYAPACTLRVRWEGSPDAHAWVSVYNFGCFRQVAHARGGGGQVEFLLGPGSYLVTVGDDHQGMWQQVAVRPGLTQVCGTMQPVQYPEGFLWFKMPR